MTRDRGKRTMKEKKKKKKTRRGSRTAFASVFFPLVLSTCGGLHLESHREISKVHANGY